MPEKESAKGFPTNSVVLLAGQEIIRNATPADDENNPAPPASLVPFARDGLAAGGTGGQLRVYGCNVTYVAPYVQRAPATASASHAFTAIGRSRVADINLSQEARDGSNAAGKEAPLPKGFSTAADRAELIAKQPSPYGWPQDEIPRPSSRAQSHYSIATRVLRNSRGRVLGSLAGPVKPVTGVNGDCG